MTKYNIPSMTPEVVQDYLRQLGAQWTGRGVVMELGCWLGASAVPLLEGLREAGYDRQFWAFDRWQANEQQVELTRDNVRLRLGQDVRPLFIDNVREVLSGRMEAQAVKGPLPDTLATYDDAPIEICIFDAPKQDPVFADCTRRLIPYFIPGVTVWGLMDYKFYERHEGRRRHQLLAPVRFIHEHPDNFQVIGKWPVNVTTAVFFKYVRKLEIT